MKISPEKFVHAERDEGQLRSAGNFARPGASLLDGIELDFGPVDVLGRFFLYADAAARERGVKLSFATMSEIVAINRANSSTWRPLLPIFNPEFGANDDNAFAIIGRNRAGDIVATQTARFFNWAGSDFVEEAKSLRLFYDDPERHRLADERIEVTAPSAHRVTGRVTFSGGVWFHPDYRGRMLTAILPRISRALAFTRWYTDWTTTIMAEKVVAGGVAERVGYTEVGWDVTLRETRTGSVRCALLTMGTGQMLEDLGGFAEHFGPQVDRRVDNRAV